MQVAKWGNSLAVRLPAALAQSLGIKEGDEITLIAKKPGAHEAEDSGMTLEVQRKRTRREIVESLRQFRGMIPNDFKFDRDEANER